MRLRPLLACFLLAPALVSTRLTGSPSFAPQSFQKVSPVFFPWGITLEANHPFYRAGGTALATARLVNLSGEDAYGWALSFGGNGCQYQFTVRDGGGNVVWQPGSIVGGQFSGPGCFFAQRFVFLPNKTTLEYNASIPLIYQNASGFGVLGAPLPPGWYQLCVDVQFSGPQSSPAFLPGQNWSACVPIQIEP